MCPSTEPTEAQRQFGVDVLRNLLRRIEIKNINNAENQRPGYYVFLVSHAWTEGPTMYLVYMTPPSDITWGLVRDTRESLVDHGPWNDSDDPALYYYLVDLEEEWPGRVSRQPGEPDSIRWRGDRLEGLPERLSDIPEAYRYTSPPIPASAQRRDQDPPVVNEPRRYANPL
jgi:hypothetical protein